MTIVPDSPKIASCTETFTGAHSSGHEDSLGIFIRANLLTKELQISFLHVVKSLQGAEVPTVTVCVRVLIGVCVCVLIGVCV